MSKINQIYDAKEYKNLKELLNDSFEKYANNIAFKLKTKRNPTPEYKEVTYKEFGEDINALGTSFLKRGFKGKRIAVIGKNRYEWLVANYAIINGTGISVPLDKGLPVQEIELSLIRSETEVIVFSKEHLEDIKEIKLNNTTKLKHFICMDDVDEDGIDYIYDLVEEGKSEIKNGNKSFIDAKINNEEMSIILFTSGTTSLAKAVMLSHKNVATNVYALNSGIKLYENDVYYEILPLHHTFGATMQLFMLSNGVKTVFSEGLRYIQENLVEYKVSIFIAVPLLVESLHKKVIKKLEKEKKLEFTKKMQKVTNDFLKVKIETKRVVFKKIIDTLGGALRLVITGAAAIDKETVKDFNEFGITTLQAYGLTETAPVLTFENPNTIKYGSIGHPCCNVEIKIDKPNEQGIGELIAKGPNVMLGYYNNEEATKEALKNGWFHSGDLAYMDEEGSIFISGRKKNVIVQKNGKNIYPEELEVLINSLVYVSESMVFGVPNKETDLAVGAKIVYDKDYINKTFPDIAHEELEQMVWKDIKKINENLTIYKHIKYIVVTDEPMIKTTTSKIKRAQETEKTLKELKKK